MSYATSGTIKLNWYFTTPEDVLLATKNVLRQITLISIEFIHVQIDASQAHCIIWKIEHETLAQEENTRTILHAVDQNSISNIEDIWPRVF